MKRSMKVLIVYDGSEGADAALVDLSRAGLPSNTSVLVVTACEICPPGPTAFGRGGNRDSTTDREGEYGPGPRPRARYEGAE